MLCWTQLADDTACQWVPIGLNLAVHVVMYRRAQAGLPDANEHVPIPNRHRYLVLTLTAHTTRPTSHSYYALATLGVHPWWKRHLTAAQITQFALDVPSCAAALALRINAEQRWGWFGGANTHCRGTHRAAYVGIGLLATYLALFVQLYRQSYNSTAAKTRKQA